MIKRQITKINNDADNRNGLRGNGTLETGRESTSDTSQDGERGTGSTAKQDSEQGGERSGLGKGSNSKGNKPGSGQGVHDGNAESELLPTESGTDRDNSGNDGSNLEETDTDREGKILVSIESIDRYFRTINRTINRTLQSKNKPNGSVGQVLGRTGTRTQGSTTQRTIKPKTVDELRNSGNQSSIGKEKTIQAKG